MVLFCLDMVEFSCGQSCRESHVQFVIVQQYMGMTEALLETTARLAIVNLSMVRTSYVIFCKHIYQIKSVSFHLNELPNVDLTAAAY